ncbi:MAG TPA: helix-turn-helix domain-containing protein [Sphingomicrobium sp.]|nr:helix-turn-helix domain-containing protein [Sphingomicrobium sp.]
MNLAIESRGARTRASILRAFAELIFRDGFENLSVQAMVAHAGIARSTFYEHFGSKEDVLRASMEQFFTVLARCVSVEAEPVSLTDVLAHFWENRRLADAIFSGMSRRIIALSLSEMIEANLHDRPRAELLLPSRLIAIHIAEAQLALVEAWLRGRAFARTGDIAAALYQSSRASAGAMLRKGAAD